MYVYMYNMYVSLHVCMWVCEREKQKDREGSWIMGHKQNANYTFKLTRSIAESYKSLCSIRLAREEEDNFSYI